MRYGFLVETYETERLKVLGVWSMFRDEDLPVRPHATDRRGRSVHEQMVHQCVSEDLWFRTMLGIGATVSALPEIEGRLDFIKRYATSSAERLDALRSQPESWWEGETRFFDTTSDTGGLMRNHAPVVYAYPDIDELLAGELAGGRKATLPGPGEQPPTERPGS